MRPHSSQIVLEPDAALTAVVRASLPFPRQARIRVREIDGRQGVAALHDASADVLVLDAFHGGRVPSELATTEFFADAARVLRPDGVLLANIADGPPLRYTRRLVTSVAGLFPEVTLRTDPAVFRGRRFGNVVLAASRVPLPVAEFDAAIYLYGQPGVPTPVDQREILTRIRRSLRPGASIVLEVRDAASVDRRPATRWWTGSRGLFGRNEHLVLTERNWDNTARATVERDIVLDIETGALTTFGVTERAYDTAEITALLAGTGFPTVEFHPGWDGLEFDDSASWLVVIGR